MEIKNFLPMLQEKAPQNTIVDLLPIPKEISANGPLSGIPFAVQNNICIAGQRLTCGSKMLEDYISPYTATAVICMSKAGAFPVCTTNMDEFGMGSAGKNSAFGTPENPAVPNGFPGGSASGAAALVASGCVPLALASDCGGGTRLAAAACSVWGMKPSFGACSRFGLTTCVSSMDQISLISSDSYLLRKSLQCLSDRLDPKDPHHRGLIFTRAPWQTQGKKIGLLEKISIEPDRDVSKTLHCAADTFTQLGASIESIHMPQTHLLAAAYYVIACAESSANLSRFTGMLAGKRQGGETWEAQFKQTRNLLGNEAKKRIAIGAYVLRKENYDQYYLRAQAYKRQLKQWFAEIWKTYSLLLLPVSPGSIDGKDHSDSDALYSYQADGYTACANLAGMPALSIPYGKTEDGRPLSIQLIGPEGKDEWLLDAAEEIMKLGRDGKN